MAGWNLRAGAAECVEYLAEHKPDLPSEFWPMLARTFQFKSPQFTQAVLEVYGVPEYPIFGSAPESRLSRVIDSDNEIDDWVTPVDSPMSYPVRPCDVGSIFKLTTFTTDDDVERSYLLLTGFDPDSGNHQVQWFYTPEQLEEYDLDASHYDVRDRDALQEKTDEIEGAGSVVLFLSDHRQRLGDSETWENVTDMVLWSWPSEPDVDIIYALGTVSIYGDDVHAPNSGTGWYVNALLSMGRDGGKKIRDLLETHPVWTKVDTDYHEGRCAACGLKRTLSIQYTMSGGRWNEKTMEVGSVCATKMWAAYRLYNNTIDSHTQSLLEEARSALVL